MYLKNDYLVLKQIIYTIIIIIYLILEIDVK